MTQYCNMFQQESIGEQQTSVKNQILLKYKDRGFIDFDCQLLAIYLCCMIDICLHRKWINVEYGSRYTQSGKQITETSRQSSILFILFTKQGAGISFINVLTLLGLQEREIHRSKEIVQQHTHWILVFTSFPVEMQPFILLKSPRFNILNRTMRVLGSMACI